MAVRVPHDRDPSKLDVLKACDWGGMAVFTERSEKYGVVFSDFGKAGFTAEGEDEIASDSLGGPSS